MVISLSKIEFTLKIEKNVDAPYVHYKPKISVTWKKR